MHAQVTRLLERSHPVGGQARARKKGDMAPLAYAVDTGRATCVEQLLAAGATLKDGVQLEPKFEDFTLLHRTSTLPDQTVAITIAGQVVNPAHAPPTHHAEGCITHTHTLTCRGPVSPAPIVLWNERTPCRQLSFLLLLGACVRS
tara:strand:+ start:73 stop:507 length:435 start_codon:yes stop_codon:yes gene_type:complete